MDASYYDVLATVAEDDGATFTVEITNATGSVTSNSAMLTVTDAMTAPSITSQPTNQSVTVGGTASFSVSATGTAPLSYQWSKNNTPINGATSSTYTTPASGHERQCRDLYRRGLSNGTGNATQRRRNAITVTSAAVAPAALLQQPADDQMIAVGAKATFAVQAGGTAPLTYQWSKNGAAIARRGRRKLYDARSGHR